MPCYMCKTKQGPFQRLEVARLRFIRKAQPLFRDDSYLCLKCFAQFETIYKSKSRSKSRNDSNSSRTTVSNASTRTVSTNSHNSKNSSRDKSNVTAVQRSDGNNNSSSDNPSVTSVASVVHFNSRSLDSPTPSSNDTMDRIVQMAPDFLSLRDSSRKTTMNPELNVARQGAEAAVESALKRKRTLQTGKTPAAIPPAARRDIMQVVDEETSEDEDISSQHHDTMDRIVQMAPDFLSLKGSSRKTTMNPELNVARQGAEAAVESALKRKRILQRGKTPPAIPPAARRDLMQVVDEETSEDEDIAAQLSPNDLAHVRPVVRRRKEPVVQQFDDIMDLYIARTSGG